MGQRLPISFALGETVSGLPTIVVVESPYAGEVAANVEYAKLACRDCVARGEVPFASHLFFTLFLDDNDPDERRLGIDGGYAMWWQASKIVFYIDRGWSPAMSQALERARTTMHEIEYRSLEGENELHKRS
jgi:hypothetical protein